MRTAALSAGPAWRTNRSPSSSATRRGSCTRPGITAAGTVTNVTATHTYDAGGRLTRVEHLSPNGYKSVETFASWDPFSRPTAGRSDNGGPVTFAYNDAERTLTHTFASGSATVRYDPNGIRIAQALDAQNNISRETVTVHASATVCRGEHIDSTAISATGAPKLAAFPEGNRPEACPKCLQDAGRMWGNRANASGRSRSANILEIERLSPEAARRHQLRKTR